MTISHPILHEHAGQNPLNKIATVDLQEAARAEKERRAMALRQLEVAAVNKWPLPALPNITPEEGLKRSVSLKRKGVASLHSVPGATLQPVSLSSTTSAQLSPGVEEIRRRSPRQPPREQQAESLSQRPISSSWSEESSLTNVPPRADITTALHARPQTPPRMEDNASQMATRSKSVRTTIRPSRKLASPKKSPPLEPTKTLLQRRPTNGLPAGPRARILDINVETGAQAQQTVMFVNNIVYNDPKEVQRIIDGVADEMTPKGHFRCNSVVHRPRPIPRKVSEEVVAEEARKHRRSKSQGAVAPRKSILRSSPGSPGQLPPLPPPPKSAGAGLWSRPHPNDTKSMTVDEKMGMFFPRPPSSRASTAKRDSQIPALPPVPASFADANASLTSPDHRGSNRITKTSMQTENMSEVEEIIVNSRFSPDTVRDTVAGKSWLPARADGNSYRHTQTTEASSSRQGRPGNRGSSPVLPLRDSAWTESTDNKSHKDSTARWNSVYSGELAVGVPVERQVAKATIQRVESRRRKNNNGTDGLQVEDEEIAFILAPSTPDADAELEDSPEDKDGWLMAGEQTMRPERASQYQWHRRVGDECPTFSNRKDNLNVRSRQMCPPTPLLLHSPASNNMTAVFIAAAEPSPVESPDQALLKIQEQLLRFEQPDRNSMGSQNGQRIALLENLEKEMGLQENRWHEMQHNLGRDSVSSTQTMSISSKRTSRADRDSSLVVLTRDPSDKPSIAQERRASKQSRMRGASLTPKIFAIQDPAARASTWQQRLVEAEMEYMDGTSINRGSFNFLAVSVSKTQLGSPTPPDSDQSDYDDELPVMQLDTVVAVAPPHREAGAVAVSGGQPQRVNSMWVPATANATTTQEHPSSSTSWLWTPPAASKNSPDTDLDLPGLSVRPAQRREWTSLKITSTQLWRKPVFKVRSTTDLWRPVWASLQSHPKQVSSRPVSLSAQPSSSTQSQPSQKPPRPVTQRPPRRNRRVTLLPDIVENPEPLPGKRGTLGIFQFPWGERSDTASVQSVPRVMAMPGTMTSGGGQASIQSRPIVPSQQFEAADEYSSSFFDDYDDDLGMDDEGEDSSDDGFDETTLWEIASLLKTDNRDLPSKYSLFPPPLAMDSSVMDDYLENMASDDESESMNSEHSIVIALEDEGIFLNQSPEPRLWQGPVWMTPSKGNHGKGLPSPDQTAWERYSSFVEVAKVKRCRVEPTPTVSSNHLWRADGEAAGGLWQRPRRTFPSLGDASGLFKVKSRRTEYQTTTQQPAALNMTRKPRPADIKPLERLTSGTLWTRTRNYKSRFQHLTHGLWSFPRIPVDTEHDGLFTVSSGRRDYRTTSMEPAARSMTREPRPATTQPLGCLTSSTLWTKSVASSKTQVQKKSTEISADLWTRNKLPIQADITGLFAMNPTRSVYRTTEAEPAAKSMARKPRRADSKPLGQLQSSSLWTAQAAPQPSKRNWLSISTRTTRSRTSFSEENSEVALCGALHASYQRPTRTAATRGDWDAALNEAIRLSKPAPKPALTTSQPESPAAEAMPEMPSFTVAQIEALEAEKLFAQALYPPQQQEPQQTFLWRQPITASTKAVWTPGTDATPVEDAEARQVRSKRRNEKVEMMAQMKKVEVTERLWGVEMEGVKGEKGEERDWLAESRERRVSRGVVLRY